MRSLMIVLFILLCVSLARAVPGSAASTGDGQASYDAIRDTTESVVRVVQKKMIPESPACFTCTGGEAPPKSCGDAYSDLYSKPVLDFRVTLGYTDMPNDVVNAEDGPRREVWVKKLLRPCPEGAVGTCGFAKDPDDADHFTKQVTGPDGKEHLVNLRLVNSSVGIDDASNRTTHKAEQDAQTKRAESNFFDGLASADVVIYAGHARKGGGPSFAPPILHRDGLNTDEKAYADRASENRMLSALRLNPHPPKMIGLFACEAGRWFSQDVRTASLQKSGVASSLGLTEPEITFAQAYAMLDSILALRCKDQFTNSLNALKNVIRKDGKGAQLDGFFDDVHPPMPQTQEEPVVDEKFKSDVPLVQEPLIHPPGAQSASPQPSKAAKPTTQSDGVK